MSNRWEQEEAADPRIKRIYKTRKIIVQGFPKGNGVYYSGFDMNYRESHSDFCERTGRSPNSGFLYNWRPPGEFRMTDDITGKRFSIKTNGGGTWSISEHVVYDHDSVKDVDVYRADTFARLYAGGTYMCHHVLNGKWLDRNGELEGAVISAVP